MFDYFKRRAAMKATERELTDSIDLDPPDDPELDRILGLHGAEREAAFREWEAKALAAPPEIRARERAEH